MWRERVGPIDPDAPWCRRALEALRAHGVVAYPTDTLYGLAADPRSELAITKLYRIKGRPVERATPLIAADMGQLRSCGADLAPLAERLAAAFWPGPLTLLVAAWPGLCPLALAGGASVAVRVPAHAAARLLAAALGHPISSTSANITDGEATVDPDVVASTLGDALDGLVDGGWCPGGKPSTIVDARGDHPILVRAGAVPWDRVLEFES